MTRFHNLPAQSLEKESDIKDDKKIKKKKKKRKSMSLTLFW